MTISTVEERAETIERSEIVEVRTYPARKFVLRKTFLGDPCCMTNKRYEIVMDFKAYTYIAVSFPQ